MDKVAAGQLRLLSSDIISVSTGRLIKSGTPYLVVGREVQLTLDGREYENDDTVSWTFLLEGETLSWHEHIIAADPLVVQQ